MAICTDRYNLLISLQVLIEIDLTPYEGLAKIAFLQTYMLKDLLHFEDIINHLLEIHLGG